MGARGGSAGAGRPARNLRTRPRRPARRASTVSRHAPPPNSRFVSCFLFFPASWMRPSTPPVPFPLLCPITQIRHSVRMTQVLSSELFAGCGCCETSQLFHRILTESQWGSSRGRSTVGGRVWGRVGRGMAGGGVIRGSGDPRRRPGGRAHLGLEADRVLCAAEARGKRLADKVVGADLEDPLHSGAG